MRSRFIVPTLVVLTLCGCSTDQSDLNTAAQNDGLDPLTNANS